MDHFTNTKSERYAQAILASRKPIVLNNALMRALGYDDTREMFKALGDWGHCADFNQLPPAADTNVQSYIRAFIRDTFIN